MKRLLYIFTVLFALQGCGKENNLVDEHTETPAITFGVNSVESMQRTKAIIDEMVDLEFECTPISTSPFELKESIGIWADYEYLGVTYNNLLSNVELAFYDKTGGNSDGWNYNYGKDEEYWQMGGVYYFRAYYPQQAIRNAIISTSSAETFIINYNTEVLQEDMMVGYESVDTKTALDLSAPVEMHLKHSMAALRFRFQFQYTEDAKYYDTDKLTACWLRNTETDGFTTAGMMVYGVTDDKGDYYPEQINWAESYQPSVEFFKWSYPAGIEFKNINDGDTEGFDPEDEVTIATAYSTGSGKFAQNEGWILIIPQKSDGTVELCFTTEKGGPDNVYSVKLPTKTGTGNSGPDTYGENWIAGYRYTYTVSITKTDLKLYLGLSDWNQLDSSFSITF
ncbi:MAG: fimbrillin family protein [Bacteroidales bacterium]|nr:fimbrillin family protein [Bacteroidales bacterium]